MTRDEKLELLALIEERERRAKGRKILTYFPDTGPLRRELYAKHTAFFEAGAKYRERVFLAGNRCISPWTWVETGARSAPSAETWTSEDARVRSWAGESECDARLIGGFLKSIEPVFRVVMDNGEFFDCSRTHQVLTTEGWLSLDRVSSLSSGLRYWSKREDYQANCDKGGCLGDQPLQSLAGISLGSLPLQADAQRPPLLFELPDEVARTLEYIRACPGRDRLSIPDDLYRFADLFALFSGPSSNKPVLRLSGYIQELRRLALESGPQFQSDALCDPNQIHDTTRCRSSVIGSFAVEGNSLELSETVQGAWQSLDWKHAGDADEEFARGASHIAMFFPYWHPPLIGGRIIAAIIPLGYQPVIDAHVPVFNNYKAGGVFHHNCGKTDAGGYELTCHLTGQYPSWWTGKRFDRPVKAWIAGDTGKTVRDIIQAKLLGPAGSAGTGFIPKDALLRTTPKQGVPEAVDTFYVKHASGGTSQAAFKSYDQKRIAFQGDEQDVIWLDEESPLDVYTECLLRTMTTGGIVMLTFTPLMGLTETVMAFLPGGEISERTAGSKSVTMAGWTDVPHLTPEIQAELLASIPPFQRDARSKGIPQLGAGAIYPVPESEFVVDDFAIPEHWPKAFGFDVGWNRTAACFGAWNREGDVLYLYSEHYRGQAEPAVHAAGIRARGEWIPGVIDPASRGRAQSDGLQLLALYKQLGLDLDLADNAVEAGIYQVWMRLSTGRLKVFRSMTNWLQEFRLYRRDEKGRIVKDNDHLMDASRYLVMSGLNRAKTKPAPKARGSGYRAGSGSWMG